jgi:hypothetical protein
VGPGRRSTGVHQSPCARRGSPRHARQPAISRCARWRGLPAIPGTPERERRGGRRGLRLRRGCEAGGLGQGHRRGRHGFGCAVEGRERLRLSDPARRAIGGAAMALGERLGRPRAPAKRPPTSSFRLACMGDAVSEALLVRTLRLAIRPTWTAGIDPELTFLFGLCTAGMRKLRSLNGGRDKKAKTTRSRPQINRLNIGFAPKKLPSTSHNSNISGAW